MDLLYSKVQNYAWILEHARHLLEDAASQERLEKQMNQRIYNNAFCGIIKHGFAFSRDGDENTGFFKISYDGNEYQCPVGTVKNILRDDYGKLTKPVEEKDKPDAAPSTDTALHDTNESRNPALQQAEQKAAEHTAEIVKAEKPTPEKNNAKKPLQDDSIKPIPKAADNAAKTPEGRNYQDLGSSKKKLTPLPEPVRKAEGQIVVNAAPYQYGDDPDINVRIIKGDYKDDDLAFEYRDKNGAENIWTEGMPYLPGDYEFRVLAKETEKTKSFAVSSIITVEKRLLQIEADAESKEYDGTVNADCGVTLRNVIENDLVNVDCNAEFDSAEPGDRDVTVHINAIVGVDADKYTIGQQSEIHIKRKIFPKPEPARASRDTGYESASYSANLHAMLKERKKQMTSGVIGFSTTPQIPDWDDFELTKPKNKQILDLDIQEISIAESDTEETDIKGDAVMDETAQPSEENTIPEDEEKFSVPEESTAEEPMFEIRTDNASRDAGNLSSEEAEMGSDEMKTEENNNAGPAKDIVISFGTTDKVPEPEAPDNKTIEQKTEAKEQIEETETVTGREEERPQEAMELHAAQPVEDKTEKFESAIKPETQNQDFSVGLFHPKKTDATPQEPAEPAKEQKPKRGMFSFLMERNRKNQPKEEYAESVHDTAAETPGTEDNQMENTGIFQPRKPIEQTTPPEPVVMKDDWSGKTEAQFDAPEPEGRDYTHDGGVLFHQVHKVVLKKKFGSDAIGPYRFVFWPIWIYDKFVGTKLADFLVHVTDPEGNEQVSCTEGNMKELIIKIDGKQFKVFATWNSGVFNSMVRLDGRTDSMFQIDDEVNKEEPEDNFSNTYLDQFRLERKGQPKHFIVPFKNNNRGEKNIPIVGYVEVNRKRYPLERRDGNTLSYRYSGGERIIKGHWEEGTFKFTVEDANRF